jgi:hypothetical protein
MKIFFLGVNPLHHFTLEPGAYAEYYETYRLGKVPRAEWEAVLAEAARRPGRRASRSTAT